MCNYPVWHYSPEGGVRGILPAAGLDRDEGTHWFLSHAGERKHPVSAAHKRRWPTKWCALVDAPPAGERFAHLHLKPDHK